MGHSDMGLDAQLSQLECNLAAETLARCGSVYAAAHALKISRGRMYRIMERHRLVVRDQNLRSLNGARHQARGREESNGSSEN